VFEALNGAFDGGGIAVAVTAVDAGGPAFSRSAGLAEDARFEIGSITKTMTATLLAGLIADATSPPSVPRRDCGLQPGRRTPDTSTRTSAISCSGSCWSGPAVTGTRTCWRSDCSDHWG
jgi:Beta-lactamase